MVKYKKITVHDLMSGNNKVGIRVTIDDGENKVGIDVHNKNVPSFLKMLDAPVSFGEPLYGKMSDGLFTTVNEVNVFEAKNKEIAKDLINKFYGDGQFGERGNLEELDWYAFGDVPRVNKAITKAVRGLQCNIFYSNDGDEEIGILTFHVGFLSFDDMLRFIHKLCKITNNSRLDVYMGVLAAGNNDWATFNPNSGVDCTQSVDTFIKSIRESLSPGNPNVEIIDIDGEHYIGHPKYNSFSLTEGMFTINISVITPGYDTEYYNPKDWDAERKREGMDFFHMKKS